MSSGRVVVRQDRQGAACPAPPTPPAPDRSRLRRLASAALVCRRWAAAVTAPELVSNLYVDFGLHLVIHESPAALGAAAASRARSLLRWLHRHSHAVHSLELKFRVPNACSQLEKAELAALCDGCVAAGDVAQPKLCLHQSHAATLGSWAQRRCNLQSLEVHAWGGPLQLLASLEHLGSLDQLELTADHLLVGTGISLPTSPTDLSLEARSVTGRFQVGHKNERPSGKPSTKCPTRLRPQQRQNSNVQVPMLPRLASLRLWRRAAPAALGGLSGLANVAPGLTKLELLDCSLPHAVWPSALRVLLIN